MMERMQREGEQVVIPEDVFQLSVTMRHDYQNVIYFKNVAFLMQKLDVKMELSHVILIYEFFDKVRKIFDKNLVT